MQEAFWGGSLPGLAGLVWRWPDSLIPSNHLTLCWLWRNSCGRSNQDGSEKKGWLTTGVQHSWPQSHFPNHFLSSTEVSESWVHRNPNKPQDCLVQNWLRITKRRDKRHGERIIIWSGAFAGRLLLWHGPDGSDPKGLLSLGMVTLVNLQHGTQPALAFWAGRHRPWPETTAILKRRFSLNF